MTVVGAGGVVILELKTSSRFKKQFKKIPPEIKKDLEQVFTHLLENPRPSGLRFEKLKGYRKTDIYTIHINGNYKISFEIESSTAKLRCVGVHNEIDRHP